MTPDDFPNDDDIGSQVADFSPVGISVLRIWLFLPYLAVCKFM